jgi:hypothetical protein
VISLVGWIGTAVLVVVMGYQIVHPPVHPWSPNVWGLLTLLLAYAFSVAASGSPNPLAIGVGDDGKLSLSKAQTVFWTYVVLYAFAAIYAHDALCVGNGTCSAPPPAPAASPQPATSAPPAAPAQPATVTAPAPDLGSNGLIPIGFPSSVLLLLGFSVTSLIAAAGITRSQLANGQIAKHTRRPGERADLSPRWLIVADDGQVDLTRFQVVLWTLASAGAFVSDTQIWLAKTGFIASLPDVGSALVLLMGVGQAAYVGGKLVVTPKARVYRIGPVRGAAGTTVTVSGSDFGATQQPTSALLMDGAPVAAGNITSWSDSAIVFTVPNAQPGGAAWPAAPASTTVQITVALGALETDPVPFTVP